MPRNRSSVLSLSLAIAAAVSSIASPNALARVAGTTQTVQPTVAITGRDFAGQTLTSASVSGRIAMAATSATTWLEPASGPQGAAIQRVLLEGSVTITLGSYEFHGRKALVWIQRIGPGTQGKGEFQVFVVLDHAGAATDPSGMSLSGDRLSVQGVIDTQDPIKLRVDLRQAGRPDYSFVAEGEAILAEHLDMLINGPPPAPLPPPPPPSIPPVNPPPGDDSVLPPTEDTGDDQQSPQQPPIRTPEDTDEPVKGAEGVKDESGVVDQPREPIADEPITPGADLEPQQPGGILAKPSGVISISPGDVTIDADEDETIATATGGVVIQYWDRSSGRTLEITAQNAVIFIEGGTLADLSRLDSESVHGMYLEVNVQASDGQYTLRGQKLFYDPRVDHAIVLDAVFWTYDQKRGMPLYLRAKAIRQQSREQFAASDGRLANTAFFKPHFSVGVRDVTITLKDRPVDDEGTTQTSTMVEAKNITLNAGDTPIFWWPWYKGDPTRFPLRSIGFTNSSQSGAGVTTRWDLLSLLGSPPQDNLDIELLLDGFVERGLAVGTQIKWGDEDFKGSLFAFGILSDNGQDSLVSGHRVDREGEFRGIVLAEHRWVINDKWTLFAEASQISDENFVDAYFRRQTRERREFASSLYLRQLDENTAFTAQTRGYFNDFIPNEYIFQSRGSGVTRLPEIAYYRQADDPLAALLPGVLSYTSEYRFSRLQLTFIEPTARELGFNTSRRSLDALGILPDVSIGDTLRARGLREDYVNRFDTRHELNAKLKLGPLNITPFAVGRFTTWDNDFTAFSANRADENRIWWALGTRVHTSVQRVFDGVESSMLDLHRLRHVIEPSVTFWHADTNVDSIDLPIYDDQVEGIAQGTVVKISLDQTFQTQRGGPGRWHEVDVVTIDTSLVISDDEGPQRSVVGRYFDYRPELSVLGDYATVDASWQLSDAITLAGRAVYDFDDDAMALLVAGFRIDHTPLFSTFGDLRVSEVQNTTFISFGAQYELTKKYRLSGLVQFDQDKTEVRRISARLERSFPNFIVGVRIGVDNATSETSFGMIVTPTGLGGQGFGVQGIGSSSDRQQRSGFGG